MYIICIPFTLITQLVASFKIEATFIDDRQSTLVITHGRRNVDGKHFMISLSYNARRDWSIQRALFYCTPH